MKYNDVVVCCFMHAKRHCCVIRGEFAFTQNYENLTRKFPSRSSLSISLQTRETCRWGEKSCWMYEILFYHIVSRRPRLVVLFHFLSVRAHSPHIERERRASFLAQQKLCTQTGEAFAMHENFSFLLSAAAMYPAATTTIDIIERMRGGWGGEENEKKIPRRAFTFSSSLLSLSRSFRISALGHVYVNNNAVWWCEAN